jgi:hypothetical protein
MYEVLSGYTSQDNAYLVTDYPYGSLRCRIWFWLEFKEGKGYRFCHVTENPKNGRINAPKRSTYSPIFGVMYKDEKGHVVWDGITEYSSPESCMELITKLPGADYTRLHKWAIVKVAYLESYRVTHKEAPDIIRDLQKWQVVLEACQEKHSKAA